jgi:hypothetical protein
MAAATDARIDAPQENLPKGEAPTQHIDRIELFKSEKHENFTNSSSNNSPNSSLKSESGVGLKDNNSPAVLDFAQNDPFAKAEQSTEADEGVADITRGLKTGKKKSHKEANPDKQESKSDAKPVTDSSQKPTEEPFKILNDTSKLDPNKPTVLFLDEFRKSAPSLRSDPKDKSLVVSQGTEIAVNDVSTAPNQGVKKQTETGFTHGEFSARLAEANGFNAIRVQQNGMEDKGITDFSKSLNGIADQIDSGKLKLGKGDVINVSLGQLDPSFEQINKLLGSDKDNTITPENVKNPKTQKDILDRLGKVAADPNQHQVLRDWSKILVETNQAIQRLQGKGIEVLHSAANEGKDTFSLEFLSANHELASAEPTTGKPDSFAPEHSRTTPANGVYPIRFQPGTEMGGGREGKYTVEGTGVTFRGEEFGNLNMQQTVSIAGQTIHSDAKAKEIFEKNIGRQSPPRNNDNGYLVAVAAGNSFANIDFLAKNRERLLQQKLAATNP